jgi:hypothetical protein
MYLRAPPNKQIKYLSDDGSDEDPSYPMGHSNSNSNCATKVTPTPKRKASGSPLDEISLVPVKKEKNMKVPQLGMLILLTYGPLLYLIC